jgi:hypothetical protein
MWGIRNCVLFQCLAWLSQEGVLGCIIISYMRAWTSTVADVNNSPNKKFSTSVLQVIEKIHCC